MLRYTTTLVAAMLFLAGSAWAQVFQIPPGHYYCPTHNEICTHGLSTPETNYGYYNNGYQNSGYYNNGHSNGNYTYTNNTCPPPGNRYGQQYRRDRRIVKQNNRQNRRIYRRYQNQNQNGNCR